MSDIKELSRLHKRVDIHPNILRFYGITKEETINGTLYGYLTKHFKNLDWDEKYQLTLQLASAEECIHDFDIVHCDLHAKNILVHQKTIKLANFSLSKKIAEESSNASKIFGMIPYVDPKGGNYGIKLVLDIINGKREEIIDGTLTEYSIIYQECWKYEPVKRPIIQTVVSNIKAIISLEQCDLIINDEKENDVFIKDECSVNKDLVIDSMINSMNIVKSESRISLDRHCFEFGIGTQQNKKKSVYWYNKATSNGNVIAKLHLANCYRLEKRIEKDEIKAFKLYE
ncbi:4632_t:CDS:2 [Funneliformis geosporum]|nr:4632_t:CDS:2 [Funneliformis geosporum]